MLDSPYPTRYAFLVKVLWKIPWNNIHEEEIMAQKKDEGRRMMDEKEETSITVFDQLLINYKLIFVQMQTEFDQ